MRASVISPSPFNAAQAASTSCAATTANSPEPCSNMTHSPFVFVWRETALQDIPPKLLNTVFHKVLPAAPPFG
jgi:hypothetical protein